METSLPGNKGVAKKGQYEEPVGHRPDAGDRIDLSVQAKEGSTHRLDAAASDPRVERVDAIAQRVADGSYAATNEDIADGLVRAAIFDRLL
ncbi:MAG: flagellar biosynthesis anti-sigma factor FlgM [Nitrospirota bacterium]